MFSNNPMIPVSADVRPMLTGTLEIDSSDDLLRSITGASPHSPEFQSVGFAAGWNAAMDYVRKNFTPKPFHIKQAIFNDPATIVYWDDGTKTVVKCQPGDVFSAETGLTTAMLKKYMGNDNTFNRVINGWLKRTGQYKPFVVPTLPAADTPIALSAPTDQEIPETAE